MTFEEYKERCEKHFNRHLSDREVAEIALNSLSEKDSEAENMSGALDDANEQILQLKKELAESIKNPEVKRTAELIQNIMEVPGSYHGFELLFIDGKLESLKYSINGELSDDELSDEEG